MGGSVQEVIVVARGSFEEAEARGRARKRVAGNAQEKKGQHKCTSSRSAKQSGLCHAFEKEELASSCNSLRLGGMCKLQPAKLHNPEKDENGKKDKRRGAGAGSPTMPTTMPSSEGLGSGRGHTTQSRRRWSDVVGRVVRSAM